MIELLCVATHEDQMLALDVIRLWLSTSHFSRDNCQHPVCFQANILHIECISACCLSQSTKMRFSVRRVFVQG